jgi:hypothetical protein
MMRIRKKKSDIWMSRMITWMCEDNKINDVVDLIMDEIDDVIDIKEMIKE